MSPRGMLPFGLKLKRQQHRAIMYLHNERYGKLFKCKIHFNVLYHMTLCGLAFCEFPPPPISQRLKKNI